MDQSSSRKSSHSSLFDDSLNLAAIQTRFFNEEQSSPIIPSSQPFNTSTVKSKKNSNADGNTLDKSADIHTGSDSSKTWTESTPSRESNASVDQLNVSPIIVRERIFEEDFPTSLDPLLDSHNLEWTSTLASPFTCQKPSESLLKTAERQVFYPSNNSRFIVSTNSSKTCDSESTLNESKKSDSFLSKSEANVINNSSLPQNNTRDAEELAMEPSLAKNKLQETSVNNVKEHTSDFFENSNPLEPTQEAKEAEESSSSPIISQNKLSRTPNSKISDPKKKNKIFTNAKKCLFQNEDECFIGEKNDEETVENKIEIEQPKPELQSEADVLVVQKSNFSQYCQDYSTQDFSMNTIDQICQVTEMVFDSPPSPELVSMINNKSNLKASQAKSIKYSLVKSTENIDRVLDLDVSRTETGLLVENKDEFLVPPVPPKMPTCKTKMCDEQTIESMKSNSKSKLKKLIYLINDSTCTQVLDINTCSNDIFKNAFLFEEDPNCIKSKQTTKKGSQTNLNKATGFVPFSNLVVESGRQDGNTKDLFVNCRSKDLPDNHSMHRNSKTKVSEPKNKNENNKIKDASKLMNESLMNESKLDSNLYTVSDTQMFQIGELIDCAANLTTNSSFSLNKSVSDCNVSAANIKDVSTHERGHVDLDLTSSSPLGACENFEKDVMLAPTHKTKRDSKMTNSSVSHNFIHCRPSTSKFCFDESYLTESHCAFVKNISVLDKTISGDLEQFESCDSIDVLKKTCNFDVSSENKNEPVSVRGTVDVENCDKSIKNRSCPEVGFFSTESGKNVSVLEMSLKQTPPLLENCNVGTLDQQKSFPGFSTASGKKVSVSEKALNQARQMLEDCGVDTPVKQPVSGFSTASGKKVTVSEKALSKARQMLEDCDVVTPVKRPVTGFSTASGKKVTVSEKALSKVQNWLESCDNETVVKEFSAGSDKIVTASKNIRNKAHSTETRNYKAPVLQSFMTNVSKTCKDVSLSEKSLNKLQQSFENCDKSTSFNSNFTAGFATASGEKGSLSKESLNKAKQSFEICDDNTLIKQSSLASFSTVRGKEDILSETALNEVKQSMESCDKNTPIRPTFSAGFSTASGKKVTVSKAALNKARQLLESCDENTPVRPTLTAGFATASGKKISVSETALNKARQLLENFDDDTPVKNPSVAGFATASGKKVLVSESVLSKARQSLETCDDSMPVRRTPVAAVCSTSSSKNVPVLKNSLNRAERFLESCYKNTPVRPALTAGFSTASGKKLSVSASALTKARQLLESCDESIPVRPTFTAGFATASGKKVCVSETALSKARLLFENCDSDNDNDSTPIKQSSFAGFATASGKKVAVSKNALNKARQLLECEDSMPTKPTSTTEYSTVESCKKNTPLRSFSSLANINISTGSGKKPLVSIVSPNKAKRLIENCEDTTPVRQPPLSGFSTASGKKVSVSESALNKARQMLETCDNITPTKQSSTVGFSTASGKKVSVSDDALNKARQMLETCDNITPTKQSSTVGFSTASGKKVSVSDDASNKARQLFDSCDSSTPVKPISTLGFSTAGGKKVAVSESALNKARQLLETCDNSTPAIQSSTVEFSSGSGKKLSISEDTLSKAQQSIESFDNSTHVGQTSSLGFSPAGGKKVSVSESALNKARLSFEACDKNSPVDDFCNPQLLINRKKSSLMYQKLINTQQDFDCSQGEQLNSISEKHSKTDSQKSHLIGSLEKKSAGSISLNVSKSSGKILLTTVQKIVTSDRSLKCSINDTSGIQNITECCDENADKSIATSKLPKEVIDVEYNPSLQYDMSPSVMQDAAEGAAALLIDEENSRSSIDWFSFTSGAGSTTPQVSNFESYFTVQDEDDGSTSPVIGQSCNKRKRLNRIGPKKRRNTSVYSETDSPACTTPNASNVFPLCGSARVEQCRMVDELPRSLMFKKGVVCNSTPKTEPSKKRERETDVCVSLRKRLKDCSDSSCEGLPTNKVFLERLKAAEEQEKVIRFRQKTKNVAQKEGSFLKRKLAKDRISLRCAVLGHQPKIYSEKELQSYGMCEGVTHVTSENALEFRFFAWDYYSNEVCEQNTDGIVVGDGAKIILDENGTAGVNEIRRGFLSSPGIDVAIVPEKWVENHYRWIVWKLACMEQRFPQIFAKKYLTMDNLLFQLKYRYDREIDQAQRSSLRKILECDEAASKRMILCVVKIIRSNNSTELELTDGWYCVKAVVDSAMMSLIQRKKILVGTKLMTQGAELLNCEQGCDPLEVRDNIRLKIHTNCTRRVKWNAKMGFFHDSGPIPLRLDTVLCGGGVVGKLHIFVARVYPLLYLSKAADGKSVLLNEKLENFQRITEDRERSKKMETLFNEVRKELEEESSKKIRANRRSLSKRQLSSLTSGQELFEYLETALDPAAIQLSDEQVRVLSAYKQKEDENMMQELHSRVNERLKNDENRKKSSTPLLKVRVVEGSDLSSNCQSTATLTVWRPPEDVFSLLKEGSFLNIYNVLPSNSRFGDISLSANFHTRYEVISKHANHPLARTVSDFSKISEPTFGEVDVVGVVIHVETAPTGKTLGQKVYLSDLHENFLAVSFSSDLSAFGWGDVVRKNAVIACSNLQWAGGKVSMKIPLLFSSEVSLFTGKPKMKHTEIALQNLKDSPQLMDIHNFVKLEEEKLFAILKMSTPVKNSTCKKEAENKNEDENENDLAALMNGSLFAEETVSFVKNHTSESNMEPKNFDTLTPLQKKIVRLQCYSPAPSLPKLHLSMPTKKLRKEFKIPSKIDQS